MGSVLLQSLKVEWDKWGWTTAGVVWFYMNWLQMFSSSANEYEDEDGVIVFLSTSVPHFFTCCEPEIKPVDDVTGWGW